MKRHSVVFHPQITQITADYHRLNFRLVIDKPYNSNSIMQHDSLKKKSAQICEICGQVPGEATPCCCLSTDYADGRRLFQTRFQARHHESCSLTSIVQHDSLKRKSAQICEICGQGPGKATLCCLSSTDYADDRRSSQTRFQAAQSRAIHTRKHRTARKCEESLHHKRVMRFCTIFRRGLPRPARLR